MKLDEEEEVNVVEVFAGECVCCWQHPTGHSGNPPIYVSELNRISHSTNFKILEMSEVWSGIYSKDLTEGSCVKREIAKEFV